MRTTRDDDPKVKPDAPDQHEPDPDQEPPFRDEFDVKPPTEGPRE
jgi:hypothetical protein